MSTQSSATWSEATLSNASQSNAPQSPADCPASSQRKTVRQQELGVPAVEFKDGVWHVRAFELARSILREGDAVKQAGFNVEMARKSQMKQPILFQDGAEHRTQRAAIARFFSPKTVSERYREMMKQLSEEIVAHVAASGEVDLSSETMKLAVAVAAKVVGLTNSSQEGMARRLNAFFNILPLGRMNKWQRVKNTASSQGNLWNFYLRDVLPAIRARKQQPQEDVISYLLGLGRSNMEILTECLTYGAAGMVTTREFICMASWHMLENRALRARYLGAPEAERQAILQEILRLEPVVGHLYRRAAKDITFDFAGEEVRIPAGAKLDLYIRATNIDERIVPDNPEALCPMRKLPKGVQPALLGFGEGNHRCPGAYIALQESDIFLQKLLGLELQIMQEPEVTWNDLIEGYELRNFKIAVV